MEKVIYTDFVIVEVNMHAYIMLVGGKIYSELALGEEDKQ
jgi:hypothetical protein